MIEVELTFFEAQPEPGAVTTGDSLDGEGRKPQLVAPENFSARMKRQADN